MMENSLALGIWINDKKKLGTILKLDDIKVPRKSTDMYKEGDIVETKCWGFKGLHKCLLAKIGGKIAILILSIFFKK
jgi:hypothetical protein